MYLTRGIDVIRRKLEQDTATRGTSTHRVIQAPTKARTVAGEEENNDLFDRELWAFEAKYAEGNGMEVEHGFPTSTLYSEYSRTSTRVQNGPLITRLIIHLSMGHRS